MWLTGLVTVGFLSYKVDVYVRLYLCCFLDVNKLKPISMLGGLTGSDEGH